MLYFCDLGFLSFQLVFSLPLKKKSSCESENLNPNAYGVPSMGKALYVAGLTKES